MIGYFVILTLHACLLSGIAYWYLRSYRKAAQRSRRDLERILAAERTERLEAELAFYKKRHDVLLRGLASGEVWIGNFIEEDPELQALCDLIELTRGTIKSAPADSPTQAD